MITQIEISQKKTSHILHLLLSIFTGGLWLPIWVLVACANCSGRNEIRRSAGLKEEPNYGAVMLVVVFGLFVVAMFAGG